MSGIQPTAASFKVEVQRLVESFDRDRSVIKKGGMGEADLRIQYLDPFFSALGWDVGNRALAPFASREVLVEPTNIVRGTSRRPDYLFRVRGIDKFICEAKKPFDHVERHYFQTQNYVYNLRLWFGVLCDFENFIVFLVGAQPSKDRPYPPLEGWRLSYWQYIDLAERIWRTFSRDAVADGALDRLAHNAAKSYRPGRQGWIIKPDKTQRIDGKFLSFLEHEREGLAKGLTDENRIKWTTQSLTESTQKIIDRILFQRICEDRHIDVGVPLAKTLENWSARNKLRGQLWPATASNFEHLKGTFNGGLYGKPTDRAHLVDSVNIPDRWLEGFLEELTADDSPYIFSVIPVEILGSVYERFLGSIVLPSGKVEPKPEVRKAGGVYYTPRHIVDFIVSKAIRPLLKDSTPQKVAKLRVLDPACGSGSFLLNALDIFCEYYVEWLLKNPSDRKPDNCYTIDGDDLRLTTGFKRQILKTHIFGVDIDPQAVEVTQMSLYLKVLEGETAESLAKDHALFPKETYLPDLDGNIKCGNSLIGTDAATDFPGDSSALVSLKPFNWNDEFPDIMKQGGFDAVIGNPPYFNVDDTWGKKDYRLSYIKTRYPEVYIDKTDVLFYFMHKAITLSKNRIGLIVSRAFLEAYKAEKLRKFISESVSEIEIVDFQNQHVFESVGITTCIVLFSKKGSAPHASFYRAVKPEHEEIPLETLLEDRARYEHIAVERTKLGSTPWLFGGEGDEELIRKIDGHHPKMGDVLTIGQGMQTGRNNVFGSLPHAAVRDWQVPKEQWRWRVRNSDIDKWVIGPSDEVLLYLEDVRSFSELPKAVRSYLTKHRKELEKRAAYQRGDCAWWRYTWPLHQNLAGRVKIYCPYLSPTNRFALDTTGRYLGLTDTTVIFGGDQPEDIRYFLGLLNSSVLTWRFRFIGKLKGSGIREYFWNTISKLPIPRLDLSNPAEKRVHDSIVKAVTKLIDLAKERHGASAQAVTAINRTIKAIEDELESIVTNLYGLTRAESAYISIAVKIGVAKTTAE